MDDDLTMPEGWASHAPLPGAPWTDTSVYELHIRDFRCGHIAPSLSICGNNDEAKSYAAAVDVSFKVKSRTGWLSGRETPSI